MAANRSASESIRTDSQDEPNTPPHGEPATRFYRQLHIVALGLLIFVLLVHVLREFSDILQQLCIATFLAYLILPVHHWLIRRGLPALGAAAVIVLGIMAGCWLLGLILFHNFEDLYEKLPVYRQNLEGMGRQLTEQAPWLDREAVQALLGSKSTPVEQTMGAVRALLGAFFGFLGQTVLMLIYLAFLLAERIRFARRLEQSFPPERAARIMELIGRINASIQSYIVVKTTVSAIAAVLVTILLWLFGVDYAVTWGVITFLLNFIPYLGSWIAVLLPVLLSLVQFQSVAISLTLLVLLLALHNGIGIGIEPRLTGKRLNLSPLVVIVALAFWGSIWGITGMILAVPLVVVLTSILGNIDETRPLADLLSNA